MYQFDAYKALTGDGDTRLLWALLGRLIYEPKSMWRAEQLGGVEHFGWGVLEHLTTTLGDLLQVNTSVTAAAPSGKKPRKTTPLYRPEASREQRPQTLDDVDWSFFKN